MFVFRAYIPNIEVVPKPSRLSRAKRDLQSDQAQRYLENQEVLRDEFWLELLAHKKGGMKFPLPGHLSMTLTYHYRGEVQDRTNIEKAVEDALVKAKVIVDDNVNRLPDAHVRIRRGRADQWLCVELKPVKDHREDPIMDQIREVCFYEAERRTRRL